jgi:L-alanine-DL-glutamate epimerase-like enolase superfamily enzyme
MRVSYEVIELRTAHAFNIARAASIPVRRAVWIRVDDGDGNEGWGEASVTTPYYGETADTAMAILPSLAAVVEDAAGGDPFALERIERAVASSIGANPATRTGISSALHDLVGKRLGVPLWKMWGLEPAAALSSFTIGIDEIDTMRERVREAAAYPILKIKVGTSRDEAILRMIREEAPDKVIRVDANTAWTVKQALAALPMLEEYGVELIEQPVAPDDLEGLRTITASSTIPVVADESCKSSSDIARLVGVVDVINIKLAKCGSLREAIRMIHTARSHRMQVMLGCMIESTLGIAAAIQLAPLVDYIDLDGAALLASDPFTGPGIDASGRITFNQAAGLGVSLSS